MTSSFLIRIIAVAAMSFCLASCGRTESYRYKLTLAVNTPDGIKRGSSVVEDVFWNFWFPEKGIGHKLRGEALYLDLGLGGRPLIALLTSQLHPKYGKEQSWSRDGGPTRNLLSRLYDVTSPPSASVWNYISEIARMRGAHKITADDLPDLVTFADTNDPKSVLEVDPNNLQAALGPNVSWNEITLESTDEPITKGIELKLPWIPAYYEGTLDGERYSARKTLANTLSTADFQHNW
jgi:hypothetical protein